jgi:hypothetical protein
VIVAGEVPVQRAAAVVIGVVLVEVDVQQRRRRRGERYEQGDERGRQPARHCLILGDPEASVKQGES